MEEQSARFTDTVQKLEGQIPTVRAAAESVNEEFQARLNDLETQAEEVLESLGVTSQSAAFLTSANREMKTARVWHALAALGLAGLVVVAIVYVAPILESADSLNWVSLAARTFIGLTLAAAASYAGAQASKHSKREEYYRQMHLQLAAVEPYLARLDEAERKRIKGELAQQFFRISYPGEQEAERADLLDGILKRLLKNFSGSGSS